MGRVVDDRGERHTVRRKRHASDDPTASNASWWVRRRWSERHRWVWLILAVLVVCVPVLYVGVLIADAVLGVPYPYALWVPTVLSSVLACLVVWQSRRVEAQQTALGWVATGRCGACKYELGHVAETDGCTVCPECGAAWRLPAQTIGE